MKDQLGIDKERRASARGTDIRRAMMSPRTRVAGRRGTRIIGFKLEYANKGYMANRTKVLLIITKANLGGAQRYVYDIARSLPNDSYEVAVATGQAGWLHRVCTDAGIRVVSLPSLERNFALFKDAAAFSALISFFQQERPDVVHLNSSKAGGLRALAARLAGVKRVIFTAHGWAFNEKRPVWQKLLIRLIAWVTVLLSTRTICVSEAVRRDIARMPFIEEKLAVIPLGIEPFDLLPRTEARAFLASKNPALRISSVWVGTIAELHTSKGLDLGIRAWKELPQTQDAQWVIVGGGEEEARLKHLAQNDPRILFAGFVEDARRYLSAFDVFFLPSRAEAFGGVLLEAGTAGLPVIANRAGGIPEVIADKESGRLVSMDKPKDTVRVLQELVENTDLRMRYGNAHKRRVEEVFPLSAMVRETKAIYAR